MLQKKRNMSSRSMDVAFNQWLDGMSLEERKTLVKTIFSIFEESEIKYFDELSSAGFSKLKLVFSKMHNMDPQSKKMIRSFFGKLLSSSRKEMVSSTADFFGKVKDKVVDTVQNILPTRPQE